MHRRLTAVVIGSLVAGWVAAAREPVQLAWQVPAASCRQVVEVSSPIPRQDTVAVFRVGAPADATLRVVDPASADTALPIFRAGDLVTVQVPGELAAPRRLAVYWSDQGNVEGSPLLPTAPVGGDDYATATYGDAWDFDEGDQDGIRSWGDRPDHYGEITVKDGLLTVPITGKDPYCIWGVMFGEPGDTPTEHIDSARYTRLRMRLRQSCQNAKWAFFFTDEKGRYQTCEFTVKGTEFQTLEFDLPAVFPQFWDGRTMRALRLDTTNDRAGATVQIDWVRLEAADPAVAVGPVLDRGNVAARANLKRFDLLSPSTCRAGETPRFAVGNLTGTKTLVGDSRVAFVGELRAEDGTLVSQAADWAGGMKNRSAELTPSAGEAVQALRWTVGVQDDLGHPMPPLKEGKLAVGPAALDHYVLTPATRFVPVSGDRQVRIQVAGADRFGNPLPVKTKQPVATISAGGEVAVAGSELLATCVAQPLTTHAVTFTDEAGIAGSCTMETIGYRQTEIGITPTGYLTLDGKLFLPLGGFYANWPAGLPNAEGKISRSVDLFPCGPQPYPHGFPWPQDVEEKVVAYLDLCQQNGVTALRLMLRNMDIVGRVDPVQLQATLHLFDLARPRGIYFNVALFEDYVKPPYVTLDIVDKICLPHYTPEELAALPPHRARFLVEKRLVGSAAARYLDPDAIRCQKDYLDELIPVLAGREEVLCYEFENEMVNPPMSWCREIADYLRSIDPHTPVLGNPGPHNWPEPWRWRDSGVDLFSYHPYNDGMKGADHGAIVYARSKWAAAAGFPFYTGEGGVNQNRWQPELKKMANDFSTRVIRDEIWLSMACGATGSLMWTADCVGEMAEFGKVYPALGAVGIDLPALERRKPRVVVTMPDSSKANGPACELAYNLLSRGIDYDVRPVTDADGYAVRLDGANPEVPADLMPEFFAPSEGWQLASLVSIKGDQALVYLRNAAGGIQNFGGAKRACWLRQPEAAPAIIRILGGDWEIVQAYDLDEAKTVPVERKGADVVLPGATFHDMVIGFVRRKEF